MSGLLLITTLIVIGALVFDFINGFHDTANAIATSVSTKALKPRHAILLAATMNFVGALTFTGVAKTITSDIVDPFTFAKWTYGHSCCLTFRYHLEFTYMVSRNSKQFFTRDYRIHSRCSHCSGRIFYIKICWIPKNHRRFDYFTDHCIYRRIYHI